MSQQNFGLSEADYLQVKTKSKCENVDSASSSHSHSENKTENKTYFPFVLRHTFSFSHARVIAFSLGGLSSESH